MLGAALTSSSCGTPSETPPIKESGATEYAFDVGEAWYGPGGVGDYASSHGNTPEVLRVARQLREGAFDERSVDIIDTGESYDLVIVGGGIAGLSAAHHCRRLQPAGRALILDNHPIFGGEAKRNEILVDGHRIVGPQGSDDFGVPPKTGNPDDYFTSLGIPRALRQILIFSIAFSFEARSLGTLRGFPPKRVEVFPRQHVRGVQLSAYLCEDFRKIAVRHASCLLMVRVLLANFNPGPDQ